MRIYTNRKFLIDIYFRYRVSMFSITYKWNKYMPLKRSAVTGPLSFVANSGGLLGLLMGVSFLSGVEILYFATIRLVIDLCRRSP
jgi:Amiloride-sensitive sodium channel